VGEYGLALEDMAEMLPRSQVAIAGQQRGGMLALAGRMNAGARLSGALWSLARGPVRPGRVRRVRDTAPQVWRRPCS